MIFADRHLGATPSPLSRLQTAMTALATATNDAGFSPGPVDGVWHDDIAVGLIYAINKVAPSLPGASTIRGQLDRIPGLLTILAFVGKTRAAITLLYSQLPSSTRNSVRELVTNNASALASAIGSIAAAMGLPTTPTAPSQIPAGAVAVRDPAVGQYRILAKPIK